MHQTKAWKLNGIPRHVKHIRPRSDYCALSLTLKWSWVLTLVTGTRKIKGSKIEDALETQEEDVKTESGTHEVDVPSRRSARERRMHSKYLDYYLYDA